MGIEEYIVGLAIKLTGDHEATERGRRVQEKMKTNLIHAMERVQDLSKPFNNFYELCRGVGEIFVYSFIIKFNTLFIVVALQ